MSNSRLRSLAILSCAASAVAALLSACGDDSAVQAPIDGSVKDGGVQDGASSSVDGSTQGVDGSDASGDTGVDAGPLPPCKQSSGPVLLATVAAPSSTLAANDAFIYWAGGGGVFRLPKAGGAAQQISPAIGATVAASNSAACFGAGIEAGTVCTRPDGSNVVLITDFPPQGLTLQGNQLIYVMQTGVIGMVLADGGSPNPLVTTGGLHDSALILGGYLVYGENAEVRAVLEPVPDAAVLVAPAAGAGVIYELTTDGTDIYWSDRGIPALRRTKGGVTGGSAVTVVYGETYGLATDATYLYAAFRDGVGHGQIGRVPKSAVNATATVLDGNLSEAIGIVVDDSCIYYYAERTTDAGMQAGIYGLSK